MCFNWVLLYCFEWFDLFFSGYSTYVIEDATQGVAPGTSADAIKDMKKKGKAYAYKKESYIAYMQWQI